MKVQPFTFDLKDIAAKVRTEDTRLNKTRDAAEIKVRDAKVDKAAIQLAGKADVPKSLAKAVATMAANEPGSDKYNTAKAVVDGAKSERLKRMEHVLKDFAVIQPGNDNPSMGQALRTVVSQALDNHPDILNESDEATMREGKRAKGPETNDVGRAISKKMSSFGRSIKNTMLDAPKSAAKRAVAETSRAAVVAVRSSAVDTGIKGATATGSAVVGGTVAVGGAVIGATVGTAVALGTAGIETAKFVGGGTMVLVDDATSAALGIAEGAGKLAEGVQDRADVLGKKAKDQYKAADAAVRRGTENARKYVKETATPAVQAIPGKISRGVKRQAGSSARRPGHHPIANTGPPQCARRNATRRNGAAAVHDSRWLSAEIDPRHRGGCGLALV